MNYRFFLMVKMSAMLNLSASKKSDSINVDVKPVTNVHIGDIGGSGKGNVQHSGVRTREIEEGVTVVYGEDNNPYSELYDKGSITQLDELRRENEVLKLIIQMMNNNPMIWNGFIIADDETLITFIKLLTKAEDVQIDADDVMKGCISKNQYRKVHSIYVTVDGETKNLKYDFPKVTKELLDLHISTKFVF